MSHRATGSLALLAMCGDLIVAIEAVSIYRIHSALDVVAREDASGGWCVEIDGESVAGWDLGAVLGMPGCTAAWVILEWRGSGHGRIALRVGRCVSVRVLPVCVPIPRSIFMSRSDAIVAAFSAGDVEELAGHPSGVVVDVQALLSAAELEAGARRRKASGAAPNPS